MSREADDEGRKREALERMASGKAPGILAEFLSLMRHNRKWWLIPALLVLLATGALIFLAGTGAAPFVYTLF